MCRSIPSCFWPCDTRPPANKAVSRRLQVSGAPHDETCTATRALPVTVGTSLLRRQPASPGPMPPRSVGEARFRDPDDVTTAAAVREFGSPAWVRTSTPTRENLRYRWRPSHSNQRSPAPPKSRCASLSEEEIGGHVEQRGELLGLRLADRSLSPHNLRGYAAGTKQVEQVALA